MNYLYNVILAGGFFFGLGQFQHGVKSTASPEGNQAKEIAAPSNCPASPYSLVVNQSDGTSITIIGKGNMNNSWTETVDGYSIVPVNGIYEYAQKVNGNLQGTGIKANDLALRSSSELTYLSGISKSIRPNFDPLKNSILSQVNHQIQNKTYPTTGNIKVLALLIDYPDLQKTFNKSNFDSLLYGSNHHNGDGSFRTYYETSSNGQLTITVDVVGWFRAAHSYLYYGRDSGYARAADLVREAVDAAEASGVNFAQYDNDNSGSVDGILAVHAGPGAEQGSQTQYIWSHRWVLNGGNTGAAFYDGVSINDYMANPEVRVSGASQNLVGIGVFAHEFGHNLGLPDLYDTDPNNGASEGIGNWGLMGGGGWLGGEHRPGNFCAWSKIENNWETPTLLTIGSSGSYTLNAGSTNQNQIYKVNTSLSNEYFLLENRQKIGLDLELNGEGLAIWHINTNKTNGGGVNADENLKGVDLEEADGNNDLDNSVNRGDGGDLFPGNSNNSTFDNNSSPNSKNYLGGNTNLQLRNISTNNNQITFDFGPPAPLSCSGGTTTLTTAAGSFSDGSGAANYSNNLNCSWLIQPAGVSSITLGFTSLNTELNNDKIFIYDGTSNTAPLLASYSGTNNLNTTTSTGGAMYVEFITNASVTAPGFDAVYTSSVSGPGCSGSTTLTASNGSFSDGSGPNNYDNNQFCSWLIQPPSGTVTLNFTAFATETGNDRVIVFDGIDNTAPQIGNFSGNAIPPSLTSTSNAMYLEFRTNGSVVGQGWDANYSSNTSASTCTGNTNLNATSGTFNDGSGTNINYSNNLNCTWLINVPLASVIQLTFDSLDLLPGDNIAIYDGPANTSPLLGSYTGTTLPPVLSSHSNSVLVEFTTDATGNSKGWQIFYEGVSGCSGLRTLTASAGTFSDGTTPSQQYINNNNCEWLIQPPGANFISLDFLRFATETNFDFVEVFDGPNSLSPSLGRFDGNTLPPSLVSSGGSLFVRFTTDFSLTDTGWEITYNSTTSTCLSNRLLTANNGTVTDGSGNSANYDNNSNCSWLIQPPNALSIILTFTAFDIESTNDLVNVYDGTNNSGTLIGSYSGNTLPPTASISGTNKSMFIEFITNGSVTAPGWTATYTSTSAITCSGVTNLTAPSGTFEDGSGTGVYDNNLNCGWLIQPAGSPASITLTMSAVDFANFGDRVQVFDGTNTSGTLIGIFAGTNLGNPITAFSGSMFVSLITDGSQQGQGFTANYSSSSSYCSPNTTLTANFGNFNDGSPTTQNYLNNTDCEWLIQPTTPNVAIRLTLFTFNTELNNDTVTVYDGATTSAPILGTYSGNLGTVPSVTSSGGSMLVTFKTNGSITSSGWRANYNTQPIPACAGLTTLTAASGTFDDGSASFSDYVENSNCQWLIQPTGASLVSLSFNRFNTQASFDLVRVYDGANNTAPLIGSYSGTAIPPTINSSGNSLFVEFTTNAALNATGWEASYVSTTNQCFVNQLLTASTDTIEDGSGPITYQNNLNCSWLIQPVSAISVTLNFLSMAVDNFGDTLKVYNGSNSSAPLLGAYTGTNIPSSITSGPSMYIEFTTNGTMRDQGWLVYYTIVSSQSCVGTTNLNAPSGSFSDGSGTSVYDNNLTCGWKIQPSGNPAVIVLSMTSMNLANTGDRVRVFDGQDNTGTLIASFFLTNTGTPVSAFSGSMFVEFTTDAFGQGQGWDATYSSSSSYCTPLTTFTTNFGNFTDGSPNGSNYLNNTDCQWLIQPAATNVAVRLTLFQFNTESANDTVTVYDGATTGATILGTFSGNLGTIPAITSSGGSMLVTFKTNGSITSSGWRANYSTQAIPFCAGTTTLNSATGTFSDGSPQGVNYVQNSNCSWLIQPPGAITIDASFNYFDTESNFDFVRVYDGPNNTSTILGTFSGANLPPTLSASSGSMFVEFTSDPGVNRNGFEITYTSNNTFLLDALADTVYINAGAGNSTTFPVSSNTTWTTSDNAVWLLATPINGNLNQTVTLLATQPNIGPARSALAFVQTTNGSIRDTVVVIQLGSGNFMTASPDTLYFAANPSGTQNINVNSNVNWTLTPSASYITTTPSTGSNVGSSAVTCGVNTATTPRIGFVTVSGNLGVSNDIVYIKQAGASPQTPSLSVNPSAITLGQASGSSDMFTVNSTVVWQTASGASWLTVINPSNTSDTNTVIISANSANTSTSPRSSFVAVQDVGSSLFDTVFVNQLGTSPSLVANPDTIFLAAAIGSMGNGSITSNQSWTASSPGTFFGFTPVSATGNASVLVTANSTNSSGVQQVSYIAYENSGANLFDTIVVVQDFVTGILSTNPDTIRIGATLGSSNSYSVSAPSAAAWISVPDDNWISLSPGSGTGSMSVNVTALSDNPTSSERITFIVTAEVSLPIPDTVFVIQDGFSNTFSVSPNLINLNSTSGSSANVSVSSNLSWTITNPASWLTMNPINGSNNGTVSITANSNNLTGATRTATILFDAPGQPSQLVTVNQVDGSAPNFAVSTDTVYVNNPQGSLGSFGILSNISGWSLNESTPWLLVNPTSGNNTETITVLAASRNNFGNTRSAKISIFAPGFPNDSVIVIQEGSTPLFQAAPNLIILGGDSADYMQFNVSSNLSFWEIQESASWMEVSAANGSFTQRLTITATDSNNTGTTRTDTIRVLSPPLVPQLVVVTQDTVRAIGLEKIGLNNSFSLFPNPSTGEFTIAVDRNINLSLANIQLFDFLGKAIPFDAISVSPHQMQFSLSNYSAGIYFLSITLGEERLSRKITIIEN